MHIDLNSCFAIIEQQANRLLRGRPVGVAAYDTPRGFVLAASYEAKRMGVKLGVNVAEARAMCPGIVIATPDPAKYREAHARFKKLMLEYTSDVAPKSIDEFVLDLTGSPILRSGKSMEDIGLEIKDKVRERLGEWVTVNIGIGPNRFLAKYAAGFNKPDGMTRIDWHNLESYLACRTPQTCASFGAAARTAKEPYLNTVTADRSRQAKNSQEASRVFGSAEKPAGRCEVCGGMDLVDLPGINVKYKRRLQTYGIMTPLDFLRADRRILEKVVFKSIVGHYWYLRLRGYEIDKFETKRSTIGHQYALPHKTHDRDELARLLMKLCEKVGRRLRKNGLTAGGIHLYLSFVNYQDIMHKDNGFIGGENMTSGRSWHHGEKVGYRLYSTESVYHAAKSLLMRADIPFKVRGMSITTFDLEPVDPEQLSLFESQNVKGQTFHKSFSADRNISDALDKINNRYGEFVITPATMMDIHGQILDRIAFGNVRDVM
jgi:nucleotidyltransferase/DNA polymerase involved in DNA repair